MASALYLPNNTPDTHFGDFNGVFFATGHGPK
jgi:hypothetical protein